MNISEGMRRLGLVAGALGCGAGAVVSYMQLQPLLAQRAQYRTFQSLVSSPVVQNEIKFLRSNSVKQQLPPGAKPITPPPGYTLDKPTGPWKPVPEGIATQDVVDQIAALNGSLEGWKINKAGVRAIHFWASTDEKVDVSTALISDIETEDGQKVYPTKPPGFSSYLLIPVFPVLGFFLPWGAIKTLTWIGTGFFQPEKRPPPQVEE